MIKSLSKIPGFKTHWLQYALCNVIILKFYQPSGRVSLMVLPIPLSLFHRVPFIYIYINFEY
jgi:hypothetical protein